MATLTTVTRAVPNRAISRVLSRLETTVPQETIMEITPAKDKGAPKSMCMTGQAEPSRESGSPKLIKAM